MRLARVVQVGRALADMRVGDNQCGALLLRPGGKDCLVDLLVIVAVDLEHVPLVAKKTLSDVIAIGQVGLALDRNVIAVVEHHEFAQAQMTGQRERLVRKAFHQVTVAGDDIGVMVDRHVGAGIEPRRQHPLRQGHAHGVAAALAQRPGRGLDAHRVPVLGMSRRLASPLPELLQLLHRQVVA